MAHAPGQCGILKTETKNAEAPRTNSVTKSKEFTDIFGHGRNVSFAADFFNETREFKVRSKTEIQNIQNILDKHGIKQVEPEHVGAYFVWYADKFEPYDWQYIAESKVPSLAINTIAKYYFTLNFEGSAREGVWQMPVHFPDAHGVAELATLPLVYETSIGALNEIIKKGRIYGEREYFKENGGKFDSNTSMEDRNAGLDDYVFTFFGRPYSGMKYGKIKILFKPDRFYTDEQAFATEDDYIQLMDRVTVKINDDAKVDAIVNESYCDQAMLGTGHYFLEAAYRALSSKNYNSSALHSYSVKERFLCRNTDIVDNIGNINFSTWEVKVPEFELKDIDRLVFESTSDLDAFQIANPDCQIPCVYVPGHQSLWELYSKEEPEEAKILGQRKLPTRDQLASWLKNFFNSNPGKKKEMFGDLEVVLDDEDVYSLTDSKRRYEEVLKREIELGYEARMRSVSAASAEEKVELYVQVGYPKNLITKQANLYHLRPGELFLTLSDVQALFDKHVERRTEARSQRPTRFFSPDDHKDPLELVFVKIQALKSEFDERVKPVLDKRFEGRKNFDEKFSGPLSNHVVLDVVSLIHN